MLPERAIQQTFMWTDDWGETRKWSSELREAYARMLPDANFSATPGAVDWLTALNQCAAAGPPSPQTNQGGCCTPSLCARADHAAAPALRPQPSLLPPSHGLVPPLLPHASCLLPPASCLLPPASDRYEVPCVVCSSVARAQVVTMLEKAGLGSLFQEARARTAFAAPRARPPPPPPPIPFSPPHPLALLTSPRQIVAADDGCETTEQAYLLASLKLKRPPMKCVVFADEPKEVSIAHDTTAKAIAVVSKVSGNGGLRRDFSHADLRVGGLDELRISQLKEVAERDVEQNWMVPELQPEPFWGPGD